MARILYDQKIPQGIPFFTQVSMGKVPGFYAIQVTGANSTVDGSQSMLWQNDSIEPFHQNAEPLRIVSTSNQDGVGGSGLREIEIRGLDANFNFITETIALDGMTPVVTDLSFTRAFAGDGVVFGMGENSVGSISVTQNVSGERVFATTTNVSELRKCYFPIPANYFGLLYRCQITTLDPTDLIEARIIERSPDGISRNMGQLNFTNGNIVQEYPFPVLLEPQSEIFITVLVAGGGPAPAAGNMQLLLVQQELVNQNYNIFQTEP